MSTLQEWVEQQRGSGKFGSLRRSLRRPTFVVAGYLLAYIVLDVATENLSGGLEVSLWYPPSGLGFALLLIFGIRYAPAVVFTSFFTYLFYRGGLEYPVWLLLSLPVAHTAVFVGAALLLVRGVKVDPRLPRMRDLLYFVGIGCLAAPLIASTVGVVGYAVAGQIPWSGFVINAVGGAAGEATGVGVLTTLLIIALRPFPYLWSFKPDEPLRGFSIPARREIPEVVGQAMLLAITLFVAYGTDRGVQLDFAYLVFLPLIWVAIRSDLARTILCVLLINIGAVLLSGGTVENTNPILIQFGLVTLTIVGVLLGGLVTERQRMSARQVHEASHDRLTGLANRALFSDTLADLLKRRSNDESFVVLAIDLDQFARVNNALGHRTGDGLLAAVAERLCAFADPTEDFAVVEVARIGDDAFAVLIKDTNSESQAGHVAGRLLKELALPYDIQGREVYATASAGVVVIDGIPGDGTLQDDIPKEEMEDLLRDADTALQEAKTKGHSSYVVFDRAMGEAAEGRLALDMDLRQAIEREELVLYYQPVFSLETSTMLGAEALVRWQHPERGLLLPAEFIPLAEQSGLIVPIGEWVLKEACRWAKGWQGNHPSKLPVTVSVNLSAKQLEHPGLSSEIEAAVKEVGLDPHLLVLEITESLLVDNADSIGDMFAGLRKRGARLAIDDFGTGYSSLSYLSRFPVDIIKLDRSFISKLSRENGINESSADKKLVSGIVDLAHDQGLVVVAEGVESIHQVESLKKIDCDMGQGYYFSEPLAAEAVLTFIENGACQG